MADIVPMEPPTEAVAEQKPVCTFMQLPPGHTGHITVTPKENDAFLYSCVLDTEVKNSDAYLEIIDCIYNLRPVDTIEIFLNSNGGWVETGIDIINAIRNTRGNVRTIALGMCASIAAVIWSCGKERLVSPMATIMYHMPSGGYFGKTLDIETDARGLNSYFAKLLETITVGIL